MSTAYTTPELLAPIFTVDGITAIGICTWLDAIFPAWLNSHSADYEKHSASLLRYCAKHGVSLYCRPHEDCFDFEAVALAKAEGNKFVIMEDMS